MVYKRIVYALLCIASVVSFILTDSGFVCEYYRINELTESAQSLLLQLGSISEQNDIDPQIDKCITSLNAYSGASFGTITNDIKSEFPDGGLGYIEL